MVAYAKTVVELRVDPKMSYRILNYVWYLFEKKNGVYKKWIITNVEVKNTSKHQDVTLIFTANRLDKGHGNAHL